MTQILDLLPHQLALRRLQLEAMLTETVKHQLKLLQMIFKSFGEYYEVIQVDQQVGEVQISKTTCHESLKSGSCIL